MILSLIKNRDGGPNTISGLQFWFQKSAGLYSDVGGTTPAVISDPVASLRDQSANALLITQGTPANRPILQSDGSLLYDATNDSLQGGASNYSYEYTQALTFFGSIDVSAAALDRYILSKQENGGNFRGWLLRISTAHKLTYAFLSTPALIVVVDSSPGYSGSKIYFVVTYSGNGLASGISMRVNGSAIATTVVNDTLGGNTIINANNFVMGNRQAGDKPFGDNIYTCGFYNRVLSVDEITMLESYLSAQ